MTPNKQNDKILPSLELAFEWVKDILNIQKEAIESIDTKTSFFWGIATAVIGIGIPLGISQKGIVIAQNNWILYIVCIIYFLATITTVVALYPRKIETMKHPEDIKKRYAVLEKQYFTEYLYMDIEQGFKENNSIIRIKNMSFKIIFMLTFIEVSFIIGWFISFLR